jgi:NAD(P)-dependent dehydrogenase (short-subunit alcohol dehydrogenase family)
MSKQLEGKVAVVTGASNGIGRGIAETFAAEGARTVLVARRAQLLDEVASGIRSRGGEALPVPADLTQEAAITALFATVTKTYGRLDVLVNNAGVATHINTEDISLEYWQEVLDINLTAPFLCSREAVRIMKAQTPQGGRIITIGSVSTRRGRTQAGAGATPDDYVMAAEDVAKVVVLMAALPPEVNLYEATILPNHMRSFIGRG